MHLVGEMLMSATQPGADWGWDLWTHHVSSTVLLTLVLTLRYPGFATDSMRLLGDLLFRLPWPPLAFSHTDFFIAVHAVVECTTGIVTAFSEARRSKRLDGSRSAALGVLMLGATRFPLPRPP